MVDGVNGEDFPNPESIAGLVITGSPASLVDREPWMGPALEFVKKTVEAGTPTLGVCFGHQMLGVALGGEVARNPSGREIGTVDLEVHADTVLLPAGRHAVNMTHVDSVSRLPAGAKVHGSTDLEPHAVIEFTSTAWGVQFHPEIDASVMAQYFQERRELLLSEGLDVDRLASQVRPAEGGRSSLTEFLRKLVPS